MPELVNTITDEVIEEIDYDNPLAIQEAQIKADDNPMVDLKFAPGGSFDAMNRMEQNYAGSGNTGFNKIGMIKPIGGNSPLKKEY